MSKFNIFNVLSRKSALLLHRIHSFLYFTFECMLCASYRMIPDSTLRSLSSLILSCLLAHYLFVSINLSNRLFALLLLLHSVAFGACTFAWISSMKMQLKYEELLLYFYILMHIVFLAFTFTLGFYEQKERQQSFAKKAKTISRKKLQDLDAW